MSDKIDAVVIGASAGGVEALGVLLPALPKEFPLPLAIVLHVPPDRRSLLVDVFQYRCAVTIREAEDKEPVQPGVVYFAPPDYHLLFESPRSFSLSVDEPVNHSRPSIDVLFESAAEAFGRRVMALVLTGSNADGARGIRRICEAGGVVAVQDPGSAGHREMPAAALQACPSAKPLSLAELAALLREAGGAR
jgi:two-component system, chemotaxis family, protein-glutamate methylesterase/glutaminase